MDGERPIKAEAAVQPGGSGLRPTNGARCQARSTARRETGVLIEPLRTAPTGSIARRTTGVLTDTRRTRLTSAALHDLRQGGFSPVPAKPPDGATPSAESHARKSLRNVLKRFKTDSEMARRARTSERPLATALASDVPVRGGPAGRNGAAAPSAESLARKNPRNALKRLKMDSEMARRARTSEGPLATALASDVPVLRRPGRA